MRLLQKRRRKPYVFWILIAVATVVVAGALFIRQRARADVGTEPGQVAKVFRGSLSTAVSATGQLQARQEASLSFGIPGKVERVFVQEGDYVDAGAPLIQLEDAALRRSVESARQALAIQEANLAELLKDAPDEDVTAAQAAVLSARAQLDDLIAGPDPDELAAAQAAVASAEAYLEDVLAGPSEQDLKQARAALASATANERAEASRYAAMDAQITVARQQLDLAAVRLKSAKYFYDALANDWQHKDYADFSPEAETFKDAQTAYDVALARYSLSAANINDAAYRNAQAQVAQAQASLALLTDDRTVQITSAREQLAQAEAYLASLTDDRTAQIASARAQLAQATASLESVLEGASQERIDVAQAQIEQARISVESAQARLEQATLIAPFDGVVTAVHVSPEEWATGTVVELADVETLEVVLDVDEIDVGQIAVGQSAILILEAWPDRELEGKVHSVAPRAAIRSEIVTYQVHIRVDSEDLLVRIGMTANADLSTSQLDNVLLLSNRAIVADRNAGKYYAYRKDKESVAKVEITIGMRDGGYTEIRSGLSEGDQVAIGYEEQRMPFGPGAGGHPGP